jgi:hypothetical protein
MNLGLYGAPESATAPSIAASSEELVEAPELDAGPELEPASDLAPALAPDPDPEEEPEFAADSEPALASEPAFDFALDAGDPHPPANEARIPSAKRSADRTTDLSETAILSPEPREPRSLTRGAPVRSSDPARSPMKGVLPVKR